MDFVAEHLQTFKTVIEAGSMERAAQQLNVTPSAVSQRLKSLEKQAGSVLFIRSRPIRTTTGGDVLLRLAREIQMISTEAHRSLGLEPAIDEAPRRIDLSIAVNADSLASWFAPVIEGLAAQEMMSCEILRHDEAHSTELLRSGQVMGAVSTKSTPVQGCSAVYLGTMRYRAMASRVFRDRWLPGIDSREELATAPMVNFDRTDDLQGALRRRVTGTGVSVTPVQHFVPDSRAFVAAVSASLGWGMVPDVQAPVDGSLVVLDPSWSSEVKLFWQRWKVPSQALDLLTALVMDAAGKAGLRGSETGANVWTTDR